MKKRLLAIALVLSMVVSLMPAGVAAQETDDGQSPSSVTPRTQADSHTDAHVCEHCNQETTWAALNPDSLPTEGHFYLEDNVTLPSQWTVSGDLVLCLNGKTLTAAENSRLLTVSAGATVTITDCTAKTEDGVYKAGKLTGGDVKKDNAGFANVLGTLNLYEGIICNNKAEWHVGAIAVRSGAVVNMYGGEISGNSTGTGSVNGGALYVYGGGSFSMSGGQICNNTAAGTGGAIYAGGSVTITGGKICGNTIPSSGGSAITAASGSVVTLTDCEITENTHTANASVWMGAVYGMNGSTLTVRGSTKIYNNKAADVRLQNNGTNRPKLTVGQLSDDAQICVAATVDMDLSELLVKEASADLSALTHQLCYYTGATSVFSKTVVYADGGFTAGDWTPWTSTTALPKTTGKYFLTADVAPTAIAYVNTAQDIVLCLNGYNITGSESTKAANAAFYQLSHADVKLTLLDCAGGGKIQNGYGLFGALYVANGTLNIDGVELCNNHGTQTYNSQGWGGGAIHVRNVDGVVNITNANIHHNDATTEGAAICIRPGATVNIENTVLSDNTATRFGGAIYIEGEAAKVKADGCTFAANTAQRGGAIYAAANASVELTGAENTFKKNTAANDGGAIYGATNSKLSVDNTTFTGNKTNASDGGAICVMSGEDITVTNTTFTGNKAPAGNGGALCVSNRNAVITNSSVTENEAKNYSAILVYNGDLTLSSTVITKNNGLSGNYGAVCVNKTDGTVTVKGATKITGNTVGGSNTAQNLYLRNNNSLVTAQDLTEGALIGVTLEPARLNSEQGKFFTDGEANADFFASDLLNLVVKAAEDGRLHLGKGHSHSVCGEPGCGEHGEVEYLPWNSATTLPTAGNYYLTGNVNLTDATTLSGDLNLCLNGFDVKAASGKQILVTVADAPATVTISDCTATGEGDDYQAGRLYGGSAATGGAAIIRKNSTLKLYDGVITGNTATTAAGAVYIVAGGTFEMHGGAVTGNKAMNGDALAPGGAIGVSGKFTMDGGVISGNEGSTGGAINVYGSAVVQISGGQICNNTAGDSGGAIYGLKDSKISVANATFTGNEATATNGGAIYGAANSEITVSGGIFHKNRAEKNGGAIYGAATSKISIANAAFTENEATATNGGAICIMAGEDVTVTDTTFTGNKAPKGQSGALCVTSRNVVVTGGSMTENEANAYSAIYVYEGDLTLDSAVVTQNHSNSYGAVSVYKDSGIVTVKGGTKITGNTVGGSNTAQNLYLRNNNSLVTAQDLTEGALIGVTLEPARLQAGNLTVTTALSDGFEQYFRSDSSSCRFIVTDGVGALEEGHFHQICGNAGCDEHTDEIKYLPWTTTTSLPTGGNYYLTRDLVLTKATIVTEDLNLCLNGFNITAANGRRILETDNQKPVTITISDCTATGEGEDYKAGRLCGGSATTGGAAIIRADSTLKLYDGVITENTATAAGGAVYVSAGGAFEMHGGAMIGNKAVGTAPGGAISVINGKFTMTGGIISDNQAANGGAINAYGGAVIQISGGQICNNEASGNGGAIYTFSGTISVTISGDAKLSGNKAANGGAIYARANVKVNISGGEIDSNTVTGCGGAIYMEASSAVNISGGTIQTCTASTGGNDIYQYTGSTLTISDEVTDTYQYSNDLPGIVNITGIKEGSLVSDSGFNTIEWVDANTIRIIKDDTFLIGDRPYATLQAAADAAAAGEIITLNTNLNENLEVDKDVFLDLNNKTLTGNITLKNGAKLSGMDSATDRYGVSSRGKIIGNIEGAVEKTSRNENTKKRYMAVQVTDANGTYWTFNRFYIGMKSINADVNTGEVGYKAIVGGNANVKNALADDAFGFKVWVNPDITLTPTLAKKNFVTGETGTTMNLRIANQLKYINDLYVGGKKDEAAAAQSLDVNATVTIYFADGTSVESLPYAISIVQMYQALDAKFGSFTDAQKASMANLLEKFPVMETWNLPNTTAFAAENSVG